VRDAGQDRLGLGRSDLRFRVLALVGTAVVLPAALVAAFFWSRLVDLDARQLRARQNAATAVADRIDETLRTDLEALQRLATALAMEGEGKPPERARELLHRAWLGLRFTGGLFLLDEAGRPVLEEPRRDRPMAPPADLPELVALLADGRPRITGLRHAGEGNRIYAMVPVASWQGRVAGVVGGVVDPALGHETAAMRFLVKVGGGHADLVDGEGQVLASTERSRIHAPAPCRTLSDRPIRDRAPFAGRCGDCHAGSGESGVVAAAPITLAPWAVVLAQPEASVLATAGAIPRSFPALAIGLLLLAGGLAWGAARSVIRPLERLGAEAEKIAGGRLDEPIPDLGSDEVGRLGRALDRMRVGLAELLAQVSRANSELEARVVERTRALGEALEALRLREAQRARLLRTVITAQEDERKRIARELHDETTQSLAVLVMGLESAVQGLRAGGPPPRLDEVKALAVHILEEIHRLILDLRPSVLDDLGLYSAVRWYAERYLAPQGISVRCELGPAPPAGLAPEVEIAAFRMCQEALSNVLRHAQAESVLVQLEADDRELRIEIEDDGRGFDSSGPGPANRPHYGLLGIRERAEILGGSVRVESSPGHGTRVVVRVPLAGPASDVPGDSGAGAVQNPPRSTS